VLREAVGRVAPSVIYVALSLLRDEQATAFLLDVIAEGRSPEAAVKALAHFKHDAKLRARVLAAVQKRADKKLSAVAQQLLAT